MTFKDLNLIEPLQRAVTKQGYTKPTPIQLKSIPSLLTGKDLIGIAQTGTGKTAAFVLPILQRMTEKYPRVVRTLVLAPTRELAAQIGESFAAYGQFLKFKHTVIFGGVSYGQQINALAKGVDIIVATPGRLLDHLNQGKVNLKDIEFFVLDEADRMLDMGFIRDIQKIIARLPQKRQSLFFSATMSPEVNELAKRLLRNPVHVEAAPQATTVERVKQCVFFVDQGTKQSLLLELLKQKHLTCVLIFTRTKHKANRVEKFLNENGVRADAIHGNKSQGARQKALYDFKSGRTKVLVATDIAARGIDIDNISHVINFELPNEPESYVHRIGRTARAGAEGTAYSFCAADERNFLHNIERLIRQKIEVLPHLYHSKQAENAVGAVARPPPKHFGNNRGNQSRKFFSKFMHKGNFRRR
ncbi:DEAD/DEAH box helicase [Candidatus Woesearchaeota archaeon]|nr:DEAD/DEAH box helicase [Candidatus Woesearchaeota archaeon]